MKVGWIGNYMRGGKGFDLAFQACKEYGHELNIAGGPGTRLYHPRENMPSFIRSNDMILSTSVFEAHPLIMYEGIACGVPVAIERSVGDGFINNVRGVAYYQGHTVESIGKAFETVEDHGDELAIDGVECINEEWTWDKIKPQYERMFREFSGMDNPHVTFLIDTPGWAWDHMAKDIKEYVWGNLDIVYLSDKDMSWLGGKPFNDTDIVYNHMLHTALTTIFDDGTNAIPVNKHLLSVNGPAFLNIKHMDKFRYLTSNCSALTTVSRFILPLLQFMDRKVYYATRGTNTTLFHP